MLRQFALMGGILLSHRFDCGELSFDLLQQDFLVDDLSALRALFRLQSADGGFERHEVDMLPLRGQKVCSRKCDVAFEKGQELLHDGQSRSYHSHSAAEA
jgi:hypothetical protein